MALQLRRETEQQIEERLKSGDYASADDLVLEGLKLLEEHERSAHEGFDAVRRKIAVGLGELDRGEGIDGDSVFEKLLAELDHSDTK